MREVSGGTTVGISGIEEETFLKLHKLPALYLPFSCTLFGFWLCHTAFGILVPQPGAPTCAPALEAQHLNH